MEDIEEIMQRIKELLKEAGEKKKKGEDFDSLIDGAWELAHQIGEDIRERVQGVVRDDGGV